MRLMLRLLEDIVISKLTHSLRNVNARPTGIEPVSRDPQSLILSVKLWAQWEYYSIFGMIDLPCGFQGECFGQPAGEAVGKCFRWFFQKVQIFADDLAQFCFGNIRDHEPYLAGKLHFVVEH